MITIQKINPQFIEHEGFYYLEFEGGFFKGCTRCGGDGHYTFNGEHDRCYKCDNTSAKLGEYISDNRADAEKWCHDRAMRRAAKIRKEEREMQKRIDALAAKVADLRTRDEEVANFLLSIDLEDYTNGIRAERSAFICAMAESVQWPAQAEKPFTDKMLAAVRKTIDERSAKAVVDAAKPAVETGRITITGTILSGKVVEGDYGTSYKVVVEDDRGFRVYGSLAKSLTEAFYDLFVAAVDANGHSLFDFGPDCWFLGTDGDQYNGVKGQRITFSGNVEASRDDKSFGFFSRPTKAAIVA